MRATILSDLFQSDDLRTFLQKMEPEHLRDDLKQELFIVLCELPEEKLIEMHTGGYLRYYAVATVLNMVHSNTSGFYRKYRKTFEPIPNSIEETKSE